MANGQAKPAMNIVTRQYKHGSIIYFEGDRSDYIYILKGGRVVLTSLKVDTGEEVKENIKLGEFFGVKSAIGRYPREETAQTVGDTTVLVVSRADFEKMMIKNVGLVTKMLRVFSNQLRRLGKMQREILGETDTINPAVELFKIGEYYFKSGKLQQAQYAYKRYLEHYPGTKFSDLAMQRKKTIETGAADTAIQEGLSGTEESVTKVSENVDLTDFSIDENSADDTGKPDDFNFNDSPAQTNAGNKTDNFFSDKENGDIDNFSFDEPNEPKMAVKQKDITEMFYEAVSLFSQDLPKEALTLYNKILQIKSLKNESERKIFEKAHFETGRCQLKLKNYKEAIQNFSALIKKFPKSDSITNSFYHIGLTFEAAGSNDKAMSYFRKVMEIEPKDSVTKLAMKKIKTIENN